MSQSTREATTARERSTDYDEKRRRILDAAARLFAEHGFGSTSVSMLAGASGGSKAWIYHYYASKEAVLYDLLRTYTDDLLEVVSAADDDTLAPRRRLRTLIAAILRSYDDAQSRHAAILNDLGRLQEDQRRKIRTTQREVVEVVAGVLTEVDPRLTGRPDVLMPLTMSLFGMLNWHHRWFRSDGPMSADAYVDMVTCLVLDGLDGVPGLDEREREDDDRAGAVAADLEATAWHS